MSFLIMVAAMLGFAHPDVRVLEAIDEACAGDEVCQIDSAVFAAHESGFQAQPTRHCSWDSAMGLSAGAWQLHDAPVGVKAQAREWVARRAESLRRFGDLSAFPGRTDAGRRIAQARASEALAIFFALHWRAQF